jgi:hypothetical protein
MSVNTATIDLAGGHADQTLTPEQLMTNIIFLTGAADAGFNIIFNVAYPNTYVIINGSGQIATLKNTAGATTTVADGAIAQVQNNGAGMIALTGQTGTQVTLTGVQTLTQKTLTAPVINGGTIAGATITGIVGATFASSSEVAKDIGAGHADITLSASERQAEVIKLTGAGDAGFNLVLNVDTKKTYLIDNQTGQACTVKNVAGTTIVVATTKRAILWNDGTNIVRITADA